MSDDAKYIYSSLHPKQYFIDKNWRIELNLEADIQVKTIYIFVPTINSCLFLNFQITYHEVEPSGFEQNADSSNIYVAEEYFSLSNLQPGRNYSISVQAVSKGIESVERSLFQATSKRHQNISIYHTDLSQGTSIRC